MPMLARNLLYFTLVLVAVALLAAAVAPRDDGPEDPVNREVAAGPIGSASSGSDADVTASLDEKAPPRDVRAQVGQTVHLVIEGARFAETLQIEEFAISEPVDPSADTEIDLLADRPGRFPIELGDGPRPRSIGALVVAPAAR